MAPIKKNDFVEIEYTGKAKNDNTVFDTTDPDIAKKHNLPEGKYGPVTVCVGQGQLIKGLDQKLQGKEPGTYTFELSPEEAFGRKDAKLVQMVPMKKFKEKNIKPVPGMQLNVNGFMGVVKNVSGGRVIVDFNHPLAGKELVYEVKVNRLVTDKKEQLEAFIKMLLGVTDAKVEVVGEKAKVELKQALPEKIIPELKKKIKELINVEADISAPKPEKGQPAQ